LFCATVDRHFQAFHLPYFRWFQEMGWEVHVAANGNTELPYTDRRFVLPIERSPLRRANLEAYTTLKRIMDDEPYDLVHCHTPTGGMLARMAAREARKRGTKLIYTAHGFHFCKGAPPMNWLLFYPIEKWLSRYTDCLVTINEEDYGLAVSRRFPARRIAHVHGVGVDTERFRPFSAQHKLEQRAALGYRPDELLFFYAAEFNKNKNQQLLLQALALIKDDVPQARLLLAGDGPLLVSCRELAARLQVEAKVDFLGHRQDIAAILPVCDVAVGSSLREGLPVNIMEAMACGLPVVASDNRGHRELIRSDVNGWLVYGDDAGAMAERMKDLADNAFSRIKLGAAGRRMIEQQYSLSRVLSEYVSVYSPYTAVTEEPMWATR
jgi:glycosyltransferase EpsD